MDVKVQLLLICSSFQTLEPLRACEICRQWAARLIPDQKLLIDSVDFSVSMLVSAPCADFMARYRLAVPSLSEAVKVTQLRSHSIKS